MRPLISIILPIYNVEAYLSQCLNSVYNHDFPIENFEVICVNDKSVDKSRNIILDFQKRYPNLILVDHKENQGLSAARNTGLTHATGEYVWFVDSDDVILSESFATITNYAKSMSLDVLLFNYCVANEDLSQIEKKRTFSNTTSQDGLSFVKNVWGTEFVYHMGYVVRFILRRDYLLENDFLFPVGQYWEDTVYFPKVIFSADKVASVDVVAYVYRRNNTSISSGGGKSMKSQKIYDFCFSVGEGLIDFAKEVYAMDECLGHALVSYAKGRYINSVFIYLLYARPTEVLKFAKLCKLKSLVNIERNGNRITKLVIKYPYLSALFIIFIHPFWSCYKIRC